MLNFCLVGKQVKIPSFGLDQLVVAHPRGASRDAGETAQATVEMLRDGGIEAQFTVGDRLEGVDAAPW